MISFPNAKINFGLFVTGVRPDGYHTIESIFYPVPICDSLEITTDSDHFDYKQTGLNIDCDIEKNLVVKAVRVFESETGITVNAKVRLIKNIPTGAGLGGGSSDASHSLVMLDKIYGTNLGLSKLAEMSLRLGADCPFFIYNKPATVTGIGEQIVHNIDSFFNGMHFVLIKPNVFVSTKDAYAGVPCRPAPVCLNNFACSEKMNEWKENVKNDFEETVFSLHPIVREVKERLYSMGAIYASMSGSGSSVYGLFRNEVSLDGLYTDFFKFQGKVGDRE